MQTPTAAVLLDVWERGQSGTPLQRALLLLAAAHPEQSREALAALSIGQRDARLLDLRQALFGPKLDCLFVCPNCGERLELELDPDRMRAAGSEPDGDGEYTLHAAGYTVRFRLPNSRDLLEAAAGGTEEARSRLLSVCILSAEYEGQALEAARTRPAAKTRQALPAEVTAAVEERMAAADPLADVRLDLGCPACGHAWEPAFDIVSYLWAEVEGWARRTLHEVHVLASAYGWTEAEVLAVSPWRRRYYLERVSG